MAQKRTGIKHGKIDIKLLKSARQQTIPGVRDMDPVTKYYFIVVWKSDQQPSSFFWRGDNGWWSCSISKAHLATHKKMQYAPGLPYDIQTVSMDNIKSGDTLELVAAPGGKFPIPAQIPVSAVNTLFFTTVHSGWLSFPVKKITTLPSLNMP